MTVQGTELYIKPDRFKKNIEEAGEKAKKAAGGGVGETAAGAILGGLVLGPFGALFGAQIGSSIGSKRASEQSAKDGMKEMGITPEMLEMAEDIGATLDRAVVGLNASKESLDSQQSYARRLQGTIDDLFDKAKDAMAAGDEEKARTLLMEKQGQTDRLKKALSACLLEKKRMEKMTLNVGAIEERAMEIDSLLRRSVSAKSMQDINLSEDFSLSIEDPLLQKFRDLEKD
eukprot:CAMPEP_0194368406 /NCGR_PEP_ID=MMETSP0174-20130528/16685_1 /TAXON_ID=216777 /ORGANISM="Proboscia alata, Strain PI-D3" /LENGTH=229 /DNA_ID=CAMNT_0039144793 /DNA_START=108 /DNA_END=800 /DNA_ORIENTATION=+